MQTPTDQQAGHPQLESLPLTVQSVLAPLLPLNVHLSFSLACPVTFMSQHQKQSQQLL